MQLSGYLENAIRLASWKKGLVVFLHAACHNSFLKMCFILIYVYKGPYVAGCSRGWEWRPLSTAWLTA